MARCSVCEHELEEGYSFCHTCGAPISQKTDPLARKPSKSEFVQFVDRIRDTQGRWNEYWSSMRAAWHRWLGSPVSIQRQILYALLSGLAISGINPLIWSSTLKIFFAFVLAALFFIPIRYWITGAVPLSGAVHQLLGPERSMRRRVILAVLPLVIPLVLLSGAAALYVGGIVSTMFSPPATSDSVSDGSSPSESATIDLSSQAEAVIDRSSSLATAMHRRLAEINSILYLALLISSQFLFNFYLLGFACCWRTVGGKEFSITRGGLGNQAQKIASDIRQEIGARQIASLEVTRTDMSTLRHLTGGLSAGRSGEQLGLVSGRARVLVFVQDFGNDLLIRWSMSYDTASRRAWLILGLLVSILDRLFFRWVGTSLLSLPSQISQILAPQGRNQILVDSGEGGAVARALGLEQGLSEYSWNELFALEGAVREAIVQTFVQASEDQDEAEKIRSMIERHSLFERRAGASPQRSA